MAARFELPGGEASLAAEGRRHEVRLSQAQAGLGVGHLFGESHKHAPTLSFFPATAV